MKTITNLWKISYGLAFMSILITGMVFAQGKVSPKIKQEKVPPEVQKIIDETMSGRHGLGDFDSHKVAMGFDKSTKLSDLKAGVPRKVYQIISDSLEKINESAPISSIARPLDLWQIPILIDNKCVTTFEVVKNPRTQKWGAGVFHGCYYEWQKVRDAWPDSEGYNPILVYSPSGKTFFHVPEKDDANLTPLRRRSFDSLAMAADTSYRILMKSNYTLLYLKAHLAAKSNGGVK